MGNILFTVTGCARCKITKGYLYAKGIVYEEFDIKAEGQDAFAQFYRNHRAAIFRDQSGIEFPVFTDGTVIRQGVGAIVGYFEAGTAMNGLIGHSTLHGEWINGFTIAGSDSRQSGAFLTVLTLLKQNSLKIELFTDGANAALLETVSDAKVGQRLLMEIKGPAGLYPALLGREVDPDTVSRSMRLAVRFPEVAFFTVVAPVRRGDGTFSTLTPDEIGQTAQWIETATANKKLPYLLKAWKGGQGAEDGAQAPDPLPMTELFKHRTAARRYLVLTEIEKQP